MPPRCPICKVGTGHDGICKNVACAKEDEKKRNAIGESITRLQEQKDRIRAAPAQSISDPAPPLKKGKDDPPPRKPQSRAKS